MTSGRVVASRYKLLAVIGRGPHGVVWSVRDVGTGQLLALKLLEPRVARAPGVRERFGRERGVLTAFLTPTIVRVLEMVETDESIGLVTEQVAGEDLQTHLDRPGPLVVHPVAVARALAEALAAAHATGVVHCGVKPTNILVTVDGSVMLSDCRIARLARDPDAALPSDVYTAPEVSDGGAPAPASDVYGLGVVLGELIARSPASDPRLADLVESCLASDPTGRPSADEVSMALRAIDVGPTPVPANAGTVVAVQRASRTPATVRSGRAPSGGPRRQPRARAMSIAAGVAVIVTAASLAVLLRASLANGGRPDAARGTPPEISSATASANAGRTPGGLGASDVSPSADGAVASATGFVHEWFGSLNAAVASGETAALAGLSDPSCALCQEALRAIDASHRDGGTLRGGAYSVREVAVDSFFTAERPSLHVVFDRTPRSAVSTSGQVTEVLPGAAFLTCHVILSHTGDGWRMVEVLATSRIV